MKNALLAFAVLILLIFLLPGSVYSAYVPTDFDNNHFGIHISDESDLEDAAKLVNGGRGQWGYVTFVIREDERDSLRWQKFFDLLTDLKLIPIVRIATKIYGPNWKAPTPQEAENWAVFFNNLNWPISNRYVVIFNEPNHAAEWGGDINSQQYANILKTYSLTFKSKSDDFFILPAAIDPSSTNTKTTTSFKEFVEGMFSYMPDLLSYIDGWNSHSYPNPGFSGSPYDTGLGTVASWEREIELLASYGINENIPVFITETGWSTNSNSEETIVSNYLTAFTKVWNKSNLVAVTPFVLDYLQEPFNGFSFKNPASGDYFKFFDLISNLPKTKGQPIKNTGILDNFSSLKNSVLTKSTKNISEIIGDKEKELIAQVN
ncbi:hypothetical protein A3D84_03245 [Candidatus Woesebacteria bacterium RIFCSPHIGHO2_02_FULL_42_20]|uniref:Asl1-like glycosyl hydrolase catalytic domain-containing protein n=1 Tax=Candidatus Woesebacteria bacterium RIFCSPHIGHO2_12_FULL_41_24 TaxID=1802510 RepID=A0A1F8ARV1_9BACT|nr:MAG: hypothetical protein A2W15_03435 [Candidatus Woesebacteria bacterium RBG_16_41_13]OGM29408.1 MAG: hypothetical protein A2873_04690 [Candidatus Woesebacteria bacterium RIFCSPHIGHO2_01_FULL_42_80]OGM34857.1 MAG: hypothetical protein A3D84_03245 [Candidatus Woesebacteria bacterium RIFCSPHIGHO2_02_FULL_42_20]OGM54486.1 MAG: hypothetical protein A3E44_00280 [Candidatus Woesebacteria bacterium RIFCSPHIGHO2_12_FULL_41_24]OGM65730.1 MAG: hypothetical protein A2969_00680 [Candidatus Woesebacteri